MSNNSDPEKDVSLYEDESTNPPSPGREVIRRRPALLGRIEETIEANSPLSLSPEGVNATDGKTYRDETTFGIESPTDVLDETDHRKDSNRAKPRPRNSPSSYFAPTRSFQAKKNEKIEPFNRQGSPLLRTSSMHSTRPMPPLARSNSAIRNYWNDGTESEHLSNSGTEQRGEAHKIRNSSFNPMDSPKFHENNLTQTPSGWKQEKDANLGEPSRAGEYERMEATAMKEPCEDLEITNEEVVSLRQRNYELVAENGNLKAFIIEHDRVVENRLKSHNPELETWKQNHDALSTKCRKLEDQIKMETTQKEATETENKKLRATVVEKQNDITKMKTELKKKDNELVDMTQYAANIEEEALESNKNLTRIQKSVCDMGQVMARWIQISSKDAAIDRDALNQVMRDCTDDDETNEVLLHVRQFVKMFIEKNENLERQLEDKRYKVANIKKAVEEQSHEDAPPTPGLMFPTNPLYSSDKIEALYREERAKRVAAEQKLKAFITTKDKQDPPLQKTQQDVDAQLADLQGQLKLLTKQAEDSQHDVVSSWESELALKQSELDLRTQEFQAALDEKDKEILGYISAYHTFTSDAATRAPAALDAKIAALAHDYAYMEKLYHRASASDDKNRDAIARLQRKLKLAVAYTTDMQQAVYARQKLPPPPDYARIDDEEFESESELDADADADDGGAVKMEPPRFVARPSKVPRYLMEPAVERRRVEVERYREELRVKREKEVLGLVEEEEEAAKKAKAKAKGGKGKQERGVGGRG